MLETRAEKETGEEFVQKGYIIRPVSDPDAFMKIEDIFFKHIGLGDAVDQAERESWLNQVHKTIDVDKLNEFRLKIIHGINSEPKFRELYFSLAKPYLESLVGNELAMQLKINLSIQLPGDESSLLPVHADTWSGDSPFEAVVWIPLVDCFNTKTMYLLPPEKTNVLHQNFPQMAGKSSETLFEKISTQVEWLSVKRGQVLVFNQALPHGNRVNNENETRWSMNCRFKSVFSPYADKKIGEFFEPITLKPLSKLAMSYTLPEIT